MPMVLRSRKSIRAPTPPEDVDSDSGEDSPQPDGSRRRSSRLHGTGGQPKYYEEEHDSDSDPGQNLELEPEESAREEGSSQEGTTAEETDMDVKLCSVLLNRVEMSRRSAIPKPASRIPTFHKKTATPTEASRAKTPEGFRERSLPAPTVRFTEVPGIETAAAASPSTLIAAPKSTADSYITVSPRPAIRADRELDQQLPDQTKTRTGSRGEGDALEETDGENLGEQREEREEEEEEEDEERRRDEPEEEGITEEQPPWESTDTEAKEDAGSWTEPDSEEEPLVLQSEAENIQTLEPEQEQTNGEEAVPPEAAPPEESLPEAAPPEVARPEEAPPEAGDMPVLTTDKHKERGSCCGLLLRCLLPLLLLLCGGFSQHLWHYGLPRSVAQLGAQLELHWLEGIVPETSPCSSDCRVSLVESIPVGLYPSAPAPRESIAQSWLRLLDRAKHSADIAAFYLTLRSSNKDPTDAQGRLVFEKLKSLKSKGVSLRVAVNAPQKSTQDTEELAAAGAEVREVDLTALTSGIIHTKLWALDQRHLYLGSANMDWRSLSQVKEVGVAVEDCSCLSQDVSRVFEVYWTVGGANGSLPPYWPARLSALSSAHNPLHLKLNGVPARVYLSSAPPQLSTRGRTDDLAAILSVIEDAQQFVHISVMDYIPQSLYSEPPRFWPPLDSALRAAARSRGLQVRLLVSCWPHSKLAMFVYLQSLLVLNRAPLHCDIQVKVFTVPSTPEQMKIPYTRVNHAKFMVTDRVVYIGTSNWSEDYFTKTAGVGLVVNQTGSEPGPGLETLRSQADQLFLRDWTSQYATDLTVDQTDACPMAQTESGLYKD